jgi:DNA topoisomerase I
VQVVIVESPAKAKTINKYLGSGYKVLASYGHVRDLPPKDGSVDPEQDFLMLWEVSDEKKKQMSAIATEVKAADGLILATDPDREGEAISWHLLEALKARKAIPKGTTVRRVTFNEITKDAVTKAMAAPRDIDAPLVEAYLARRALDYLVGFNLSPVLWRKLPGAKSAGRVQSVALRLICQRESEIEAFVSREYWTIEADMAAKGGEAFTARLVTLDGKKLDKFDLPNQAHADKAKATVSASRFTVSAVEKKPVSRNPAPPFTTSTLQQEAARKFGFTANQTMRIAQQLYEGVSLGGETTGLITYMRTDGVQMAGEAIAAARRMIEKLHGADYMPEKPRFYSTKAKNAQEAHEAIRPTDMGRLPKQVAGALSDEQRKLYDLIWKRAIASQMASAKLERTSVDLLSDDKKTSLRATGQVLLFPGFIAVYQEDRDEPADDEDGARLPALSQGDTPALKTVRADQHFTEPPPRYSEASLVKKLEELGIGRPSTYASILTTLRDRAYVRMEAKRFVPEDKGRLVTAFLEKFFERYVEYSFTAGLEEQLDEVSAGKVDWKEVLRAFWQDFHPKTQEVLGQRPSDVTAQLDTFLEPLLFKAEEGKDARACPSCAGGRLSLKVGRFGAFVGCSNYPECKYTRPFGSADADAKGAVEGGDKPLGDDPASGKPVFLKNGRFGPYVEMEAGEKPARASIPKDVPLETLNLETALKLLSLPRTVGAHPESGKPVTASIGRYGPYLAHDGKYARLTGTADVFEVGLNRAVVLLAEERKGGRASAPAALKELGAHPESQALVKVMNGRFGPYVTDGTTNATLPRALAPEALTLDEAVRLLAERAARAPAKKPVRGKKAAEPAKAEPKKAAAKKAPAKKTAAKKPAAKKPTKKPAAKAKKAKA